MLTVAQNNPNYTGTLFDGVPMYINQTFYVLDKNKKEEINMIKGKEGEYISFDIKSNHFGYLIYDNCIADAFGYTKPNKIHFIDLNGKTKWSRGLTEIEKENITHIHLFIDEENAIYGSDYDGYRLLNMKNYELQYVIEKSKLIRLGDLYNNNSIYYSEGTWLMELEKILYVYSEIERAKDSITGNSIGDVIRNTYAYEINPKDGEIIGFGKHQ